MLEINYTGEQTGRFRLFDILAAPCVLWLWFWAKVLRLDFHLELSESEPDPESTKPLQVSQERR